MQFVFEKESKRNGNDCLIEEGFYIMEIFDNYLAYHLTHYSGWFGSKHDCNSEYCSTEKEARKFLKKWGCEDA